MSDWYEVFKDGFKPGEISVFAGARQSGKSILSAYWREEMMRRARPVWVIEPQPPGSPYGFAIRHDGNLSRWHVAELKKLYLGGFDYTREYIWFELLDDAVLWKLSQ